MRRRHLRNLDPCPTDGVTLLSNAYILPRMAHGYGYRTTELLKILRASVLVLCIPYGVWLIFDSPIGQQLLALALRRSVYGLRFVGIVSSRQGFR